MKTGKLTEADFDAASRICFAVKIKLVNKMYRLEGLAEKETGQKKEHLLNLAAHADKRAFSYLKEGLRASEGNIAACERAFAHHVIILKNYGRNDP